jgi:Transglycosylase SLT domain
VNHNWNCRTATACFLSFYFLAVFVIAMVQPVAADLEQHVSRSLDPPLPSEFIPSIPPQTVPEMLIRESELQGLPPMIALKVAWRESRWTDVVSPSGDSGVMQLNPRYFREAPQMTREQNIHAGVCLLAKYWREYHDERLTWIAYNRGPAAAARLASQER